jgi:single-stranded DNA-binding protein
MNKVIIVGHLGANPEVYRGTDPANPYTICRFSVATNTKWKDQTTGQQMERTEWHKIKTTGKTAEACANYLAKGRHVLVEGEIRKNEYMGDAIDAAGNKILYADGNPVKTKMFSIDIVVSRGGTVKFLDKNPNAQNAYVQNGMAPVANPAVVSTTPPITNPVNAATAGMINAAQNVAAGAPGTPFVANGQVVGTNVVAPAGAPIAEANPAGVRVATENVLPTTPDPLGV